MLSLSPTTRQKEKILLQTEDLVPSKSPETEFKKAVEDIKSSDWEEIYDSVDSLRRLSVFHPSTIAPHV
jgi:hypothetical protein